MLDNFIFTLLNITTLLMLLTLINIIRLKNKDKIQWVASIIAILGFIWCSGYLTQAYIYYFSKRTFFPLNYYSYIGTYFLPTFLLIFVILYIKPEQKLTYKLLLIFFIPLTFYILLLTNKFHHYIFIKYAIDEDFVYGKALEFINLYTYIIFAIIIWNLIFYVRNNFKLSFLHSLIIILGTIFPFASNLIVTLKILKLPLYTTPTTVCFSLLFIYYGVIKYRFLEINSISQKLLLNSISDAFIVIDKRLKVIDYNKTFEIQFNIPKTKKGFNFFDQFDQNEFEDYINQAMNSKNKVVLEKKITNKAFDKYFIIDIIPVIDHNYPIGTIIIFKDVTELNQKNFQLQQLFDQLKQHAATIEELTVVKERNRMSCEVHDTIGHTMTSIKALLDLSLIQLSNSSLEEAAKAINEAREFTQESMREIRCSILGLSSFGLESGSMIDAVKSLILKFEHLGINIDFSVDDPEQYRKNINFSVAVYRLCQEALTNSVRHGQAKNISIIIKILNGFAKISIIDDGCGCQNIHKGFGLSGMERRVKNLDGEILFGSDGTKGFYIYAKIPIKELI